MFTDPDVIKTFDQLKKSGKIKFAGFSCHDRDDRPSSIEAGSEGRLDRSDDDPV